MSRAPTVHVARHGMAGPEARKVARPVPRSGAFHHFPLDCQTALKRASCPRRCCTVFGGAYVGSLSSSPGRGWPAAGICRGEGGLQHHRSTLFMYPIPIGKEDVPEVVDIHLHMVSQSYSPPRTRWCIICDLTPVDVSLLRCHSSPIGNSLFLCYPLHLMRKPSLHIPSTVVISIVEAYHAEHPQILQGQGPGRGRRL